MAVHELGNQEFCNRVLADPRKTTFRFLNLNDSVAHVPPESAGYWHAPQNCFCFDENGNLSADDGSFRGEVAALAAVFTRFPVDLSFDLAKIPARQDWSTTLRPVIASAFGTAYEMARTFVTHDSKGPRDRARGE